MRRVWPLILMLAACSAGSERVVVAAGTTLVDSGLIDRLAIEYEATHPGVDLSVVGDASAAIFLLAENGAADVTITHAPDLEAKFLASGGATTHAPVFSSRFVLVGPSTHLERLRGMDAVTALRRIAQDGDPFVSRADGSGTNLVELRLWGEAGIDPSGAPWYIETGQGMGPTLQIASEREAFTLSELGSFLAARSTIRLVDLEVDRRGLDNPYLATAVAGSPVEDRASDFVEWLVSEPGVEALVAANQDLFGAVVFEPFPTD